jgi:hypothetical protein
MAYHIRAPIDQDFLSLVKSRFSEKRSDQRKGEMELPQYWDSDGSIYPEEFRRFPHPW